MLQQYYANTIKVGPLDNPREKHEYYSIPYCAPESTHQHPEASKGTGRWNEWKPLTKAERLAGGHRAHELRNSGYDIMVLDSTEKPEKCTTQPLTSEQVEYLSAANRHRWIYRMHLNDLPVFGMVGETFPAANTETALEEGDDLQRFDPYVYTTRSLIISYNNDRVVKVDITDDPKSFKRVEEGAQLDFAIHVRFEETIEEFHSRLD